MRFTVTINEKVLEGGLYLYVDIPEEAQADALINYTLNQVRERYGVPPEIKLRLCDLYGKTIARKQTCKDVHEEGGGVLVVKEGML